MFGFLIGAACLVGLIKVLRRGYGWGYGGCGRGCSHGGHDSWSGPHGGGPERWQRFGHRMFLRRIFERLETTPGQEKLIVDATSELREIFRKAGDEFRETRNAFAELFRGESLDDSLLTDLHDKQDTTIRETRSAVLDQIRRIHDALTEEQRSTVADFIQRNRGRRGFGGPYRAAWM